MSDLTINENELIAEVTPGEYLMLKCISAGNMSFLRGMKLAYPYAIKPALTTLEDREYIHINGNSFEQIELLPRALVMFGKTSKKEQVTEVLEYLNRKLNMKRGFNTAIHSNRRLVNARLAEKYTVEDLKSVIDTKYKEWTGTEYAKFLRPSTLFGSTHFQSYIVQASAGQRHTANIGSPINKML